VEVTDVGVEISFVRWRPVHHHCRAKKFVLTLSLRHPADLENGVVRTDVLKICNFDVLRTQREAIVPARWIDVLQSSVAICVDTCFEYAQFALSASTFLTMM
jgi:hypothetical protein